MAQFRNSRGRRPYGVEFVGFLLGFKGATSWGSSVLWGLYSIFGYEVFIERNPQHAFTPGNQVATPQAPAAPQAPATSDRSDKVAKARAAAAKKKAA